MKKPIIANEDADKIIAESQNNQIEKTEEFGERIEKVNYATDLKIQGKFC